MKYEIGWRNTAPPKPDEIVIKENKDWKGYSFETTTGIEIEVFQAEKKLSIPEAIIPLIRNGIGFGQDGSGWEVRTPPAIGPENDKFIDIVCETFDKNGYIPPSSAGIHIHIMPKIRSVEERFKIIGPQIVVAEDFLFGLTDIYRLSCGYCMPVHTIWKIPKTGECGYPSKRIGTNLATEYQTMEFRYFHSTLNPKLIKNWVRVVTKIVESRIQLDKIIEIIEINDPKIRLDKLFDVFDFNKKIREDTSKFMNYENVEIYNRKFGKRVEFIKEFGKLYAQMGKTTW